MIYGNQTLMDRVTTDLFDNFSYTNRKLKVYDVEPYIKGNLKTFPADPAMTISVTNNVLETINGEKYLTFYGAGNGTLTSSKAKTAMRWFVLENTDGTYIMAGRVGSFLHGLPLNTERLIVDNNSTHSLYTFQMKVEMDESDTDALDYSKTFDNGLNDEQPRTWDFTPNKYYSILGTAQMGSGMPPSYVSEIYGDIIWMKGKASGATGWVGQKFTSDTNDIIMRFNASQNIEEIWINGVQISDGTNPNENISSAWSDYNAIVVAGEENFISIKVSNASGVYGISGNVQNSNGDTLIKTDTTWVSA